MNPVWPLSPQKDASYYLLHMTPHGKSRAVYIALLQQPPDCLMLVFFSVMNTLSKGWHLRLSMLEINDRSAVITFKHLLSSCLCRMSILQQYHNNIPTLWSQYIVVYTRENMGLKFKKERNLQEVAHYSPQMLISIFFLNSFEWSGFECCTYELKNFSQKMLILICKHLSCIYILSHFFPHF